MKKSFLLFLAALPSAASIAANNFPVGVDPNVVAGVNVGAVKWEEYCPTVAAVPLDNGWGKCSKSHPTDVMHKGGKYAFPPGCESIENRYSELTHPGKHAGNKPWQHCEWAYTRALIDRNIDDKRNRSAFKQSFDQWKQQNFSSYLDPTL